MTHTLPQVAHEHHERLLQHVNRMPEVGDLLLTAKADEVARAVDEMSTFLSGTLIPHLDAAEGTLYPQLERMFQNRHSMAPMRREHEAIRRLVAAFARLRDDVGTGQLTLGRLLAIRRVLFQVYALLKVHLAEEEAYLRILDHGVDAEIGEMLAAAMEHPVTQLV